MARRFFIFTIAGFIITATLGFQSQSMVKNLPAPNFNGPPIAAAPAPVVPQPSLIQPRISQPTAIAGDRAWAPPVPPRAWKWIVVHHSASPSGSASVFDRMHRERGFDELGYDFVIGNGTESGNGQVEVGSRWTKQKIGAHDNALDNRYNEYGIGICLVGNFQIERPTPQQLQSLAKLTSYLMQKYRIPAGNVVGHRDTKQTECPGNNLNLVALRRMANDMLAAAGEKIQEEDQPQTAAGTELMVDVNAGK